ncbi:MAG: hypothetical protein V1738_04355 [Patescibacteria group bacterium]
MSNNEIKTFSLGTVVGIAAVALAVGLVGGYFVGHKTISGTILRQGDRSAAFDQLRTGGGRGIFDGTRDGSNPTGVNARAGNGMNMVSGEIKSVDGNTVTIGLEDGSSKVIVLTSNTAVTELSELDRESLSAGANVFVTAEADESGALIATMLQIRPVGLEMMGAGFRGGLNQPLPTPTDEQE